MQHPHPAFAAAAGLSRKGAGEASEGHPSASLARSVAGEGQGEGADLTALKRLIIEKTEGNPLFMEEMVQVLFDEGVLVRNGAVKIAKSLSEIKIPPTVQGIIAARIDRLPAEEKELLQALAVIGMDFPASLVRQVVTRPEAEVQPLLSNLQLAEFIYEQPAFPEIEYTFKHALTHDVAYNSVLIERRKLLHERAGAAIEALFAGKTGDHLGELAHHYGRSANTLKAVEYLRLAGEQALQRWANVEAISRFASALGLLKTLEDTPQRAEQELALLLAQGEAQGNAGEYLDGQETLLRAADIARARGATESFVRAAAELAFHVGTAAVSAGPAVRVLEEALQTLGAEDSLLKAKTLGGLARVLGMSAEPQQVVACAEQAVAMARRLNDPGLISFCLYGMFLGLRGPEYARQRLAIATEMRDLAKTAAKWSELSYGHWWRAHCLFELGDMPAADAEIEVWGRFGEERQIRMVLSLHPAVRAMRALMQGRFGESEGLAQQAFASAQAMQADGAAGVFGLQMFTLRREQGRLREVEPAVRFFVQQQGAAAAWRPSLAVIYSELGRTEEARAEFEELARHDFADLPRDALWTGSMSYLADVCAFLGDRGRAATLYQMLLPFADLTVLIANASVCYGSVSRYLGALATTLERWDDAVKHFEEAIAMNARMEARTWLAHTQYQYAAMLLARDQPGDRDKARGLLREALATARELGMHALEERITAGTG